MTSLDDGLLDITDHMRLANFEATSKPLHFIIQAAGPGR